MLSSLEYSYYISFIDAYSRYTWIYFLKSKSDALNTFKQFKTVAELQLNACIKAVQSDLGGGGVSFGLSNSTLPL